MRVASHGWRSRLPAFSCDLLMIPIAWLSAYWICFDLHPLPTHFTDQAVIFLPYFIILQCCIFWFVGLYRGVWRFASIPDLIRIFQAVGLGTVVTLVSLALLHKSLGVPRAVPVIYFLLLFGLLAGTRLFCRWYMDYRRAPKQGQRVLIVGAGGAGEGLVRDLLRNVNRVYKPVGFVDDSPAKRGCEIHGVRVLGKSRDIPQIVSKHKIDMVFIALPSVGSAVMRRIVNICEQTSVPFRTSPGLKDIVNGNLNISALREVALEDLLGRNPVRLDKKFISSGLRNKIILVSGGGGSIGSELCNQIAPMQPAELIIIDSNEYNLYKIEQLLLKRYPHLNFKCLLQDVTDRVGMQNIMSQYRPQFVFHAAAYKHVPLLESQARIAVYNNIVGTRVIAEAAIKNNVETFVLISTDKAVRPKNVMGTTKRVSELICQNLNAATTSSTKFITVRFGNVLDSSGSVVPLFRQQLQEGGPITITHPDITRYFMTIPEAAQLIMHSSVMGKGGEVFVLDMGEPIKIRYLAEQMIKLSGKTLGRDVQIVYTGLRSGEKLYEELFYEAEKLMDTAHPKIMQAGAYQAPIANFNQLLDGCEKACKTSNEHMLYSILNTLVPEYRPYRETVTSDLYQAAG